MSPNTDHNQTTSSCEIYNSLFAPHPLHCINKTKSIFITLFNPKYPFLIPIGQPWCGCLIQDMPNFHLISPLKWIHLHYIRIHINISESLNSKPWNQCNKEIFSSAAVNFSSRHHSAFINGSIKQHYHVLEVLCLILVMNINLLINILQCIL